VVVSLGDIVSFCDDFLNISSIEDYPLAYNGLQFENSGNINKIGAAVDFNMQSLKSAISNGVDLLFVHHGMFWGKTLPIKDIIYKKYKMLIESDLAVYSAHLPIDVRSEIGNNVSILKLLGVERIGSVSNSHFDLPIASANCSRSKLRDEIFRNFPRTIAMEYGPNEIEKVAVCSGGGGSEMVNMIKSGAKTVIIGEVQRHHFDVAYDNRINLYVCGHYDTEVFGIRNLSEVVAKKFNLENVWIKEDCIL
jgi:dinuclear metal center YbgI/SA1388 family protein